MSISGNLRTMLFADLLQWVSQSRKSGTLVLEGKPFKKKVYFRTGQVIAASSENPKEFLTYYLLGWGVVSREELEELLALQERHGTLLGELLVILGKLSREQLAQILQVRTEEAVYELFLWDEGGFRFLDNILPAKKLHALDLPADMLILEGVRRRDECSLIREVVPSPSHRPRVVKAIGLDRMGDLERSIVAQIDGSNSIEAIALACRLAVFPVLEFVYQGAVQGLFEILPPSGHEELVSIPGLASGAWRRILEEAREALAGGRLDEAFRGLRDLRTKYAEQTEAQKQADELEASLSEAVAKLGLEDAAVPELAIALAELTRVDCSPEDGFLLSRINGTYALGEIVKLVPGSPLEVRVRIHALLKRELIRIRG